MNDNISHQRRNLEAILRLGVAVISNILIIFFFPELAKWGGELETAQRYLLFALLAGMTLLILVPVIRNHDPGYKISATMLALLPAFVLVGCVWTLLF